MSFNIAGQTLSGAPQFVSVGWIGSSLELNGTGTATLTYRILSSTNIASTNWIAIGSATVDSNGNFQFTESGASSYPQRFYRATWP